MYDFPDGNSIGENTYEGCRLGNRDSTILRWRNEGNLVRVYHSVLVIIANVKLPASFQAGAAVKDWCALDQECYTLTGAGCPVTHIVLAPPPLLLHVGETK